jgi:glucose-6-phosphate 1-dehydrogenase
MSNHQPTIIVILGGGGDLAQRKLLPALFDLYIQKNLPEVFRIFGLARTQRSDEEYRQLVSAAIHAHHKNVSEAMLGEFCSHIFYLAGSFEEEGSYDFLTKAVHTYETELERKANKLFYLAVPPAAYENIFKNLHASSLAVTTQKDDAWSRILVEKPFGNDYTTALELDTKLSSFFREDQIFRIDHYLAKEAVLNILSFRFANTLLRSPWNKDFIKEVRITMHESLNASARGSFYDTVGALRDVGQNHLLQILALISMEEPSAFEAKQIRDQRARILEKLIPFTEETIQENAVRAQYEGFRNTQGVKEDSTTETYFEFKAYIDDETWRDVPFFISAGKALRNDQVVVEILFHDVHSGPFEPKEKTTVGNSIILTISPVQSMNIMLNVKKPGHGYELETRTLSFAWDEGNEKGYTAYEKVLLDCIQGDQTLFTKTEEVLASWKFITSITENWDEVPLQTYEEGSTGPEHTLIH